jgi:BirA family biotin operon repressor/biotin-[acetyl-CoA-carboxylase] ligase
MHHIHLSQTSSTQEEVKRALKQGSGDYLVSTDKQMAGVGRQGSEWHQFENALAFSFTLKPNETLTLTPLEIGVHLAKFFSPKLKLKWPNDLLSHEGEKVGGILCQLVGEIIVVGIGINLKMPTTIPAFPYQVSSLFNSDEIIDPNIKKELPLKIVNYILNNRLSSRNVRNEFIKSCVHINKKVTILNNENQVMGKFIGIGENGEALLETGDNHREKILTGSLRY